MTDDERIAMDIRAEALRHAVEVEKGRATTVDSIVAIAADFEAYIMRGKKR